MRLESTGEVLTSQVKNNVISCETGWEFILLLFYCEILKTLEQIIKTVYILLLHYGNNNQRNVAEIIISDLRGKM